MTRKRGYGIATALAAMGTVLLVWDVAELLTGRLEATPGFAGIGGGALIVFAILFAAWARTRAAETREPPEE